MKLTPRQMRFLTKAIQGIRQTGAAITPRVAGVAAGIGLGGYGAVKLGQYQAEKFREGRFSRHSYRNFVDAMNERAASEKLYGYNHPGFGFGIYDKPYAENLTAKRVSFEAQRQQGLERTRADWTKRGRRLPKKQEYGAYSKFARAYY